MGVADNVSRLFDDDETQPAYQVADVTSKLQNRLKIIRPDKSTLYIPYQHIQRHILSTQHDMLTLICSGIIIIIEGQNLEDLADKISDERVKAIHCFDPQEHPPLPDNAPCITTINDLSPSELSAD